jgi:hypothetical protein
MSQRRRGSFRLIFDDVRGGTGFVEYLVLVGLIALGGLAGFRLLGSSIAAKANDAARAVDVGAATTSIARSDESARDRGEDGPRRDSESAVTSADSLPDTPEVSPGVTAFATAGLVLGLGIAFTLWLRTKHARGELATATSSELPAGDRGRT